MVQLIPKINIFIEHLGSLEGLSRCLKHCFLRQYQVICHHFNFISFKVTLLKSANIDFSRLLKWLPRFFNYCLQSYMTLEKNAMNRKTLFPWIHSSLGLDHTPPLLLQIRFRDGIISYFLLSVLACKLPFCIKVQDIAWGKEDFMSKLSVQDCFLSGNAAGLCMLAIAKAVW